MRQISKTVSLGDGLAAQLAKLKATQPVEAVISSNLPYINALEHGTSQQAPAGMVRNYRHEYEAMVAEGIARGIADNPDDLQRALVAGVTDGTLQVMAAIAERTPVDTGRAKGSWIATLPGGKRVGSGPTISAEQQHEIRRTRRKNLGNRRRRG